jgi:hypothetical protein
MLHLQLAANHHLVAGAFAACSLCNPCNETSMLTCWFPHAMQLFWAVEVLLLLLLVLFIFLS